MRTPTRAARLARLARVVAVALVLLLGPTALTACGGGQAPAESAPQLQEALDDVDAAVEEGDDAGLRRALDELATQAARARVGGEITDEQADRILDAVAGVLAALERGTPDAPGPPAGGPFGLDRDDD
jgi:hypothetical protein